MLSLWSNLDFQTLLKYVMTSVSISEILDISKQGWGEFGEAGKGHFPSAPEITWVAYSLPRKADLVNCNTNSEKH